MTVINWQTITESEAFNIYFQLRAKFDWCGTPTSMGDVLVYKHGETPDWGDSEELTSVMREAVRDTYEWRTAIDERTSETANSMVPSIEVYDNGDFIIHTESTPDLKYEAEEWGTA